jgi:hypothetical protein
MESDPSHLRLSAETERQPPVARAGVDVQHALAVAVNPHGPGLERTGQAPAESGDGELAPVRVPAQRERDTLLS